jgi:hypothetical protein
MFSTSLAIAACISVIGKTNIKNWHLILGVVLSVILMSLSYLSNEKIKQIKSRKRKINDCL